MRVRAFGRGCQGSRAREECLGTQRPKSEPWRGLGKDVSPAESAGQRRRGEPRGQSEGRAGPAPLGLPQPQPTAQEPLARPRTAPRAPESELVTRTPAPSWSRSQAPGCSVGILPTDATRPPPSRSAERATEIPHEAPSNTRTRTHSAPAEGLGGSGGSGGSGSSGRRDGNKLASAEAAREVLAPSHGAGRPAGSGCLEPGSRETSGSAWPLRTGRSLRALCARLSPDSVSPRSWPREGRVAVLFCTPPVFRVDGRFSKWQILDKYLSKAIKLMLMNTQRVYKHVGVQGALCRPRVCSAPCAPAVPAFSLDGHGVPLLPLPAGPVKRGNADPRAAPSGGTPTGRSWAAVILAAPSPSPGLKRVSARQRSRIFCGHFPSLGTAEGFSPKGAACSLSAESLLRETGERVAGEGAPASSAPFPRKAGPWTPRVGPAGEGGLRAGPSPAGSPIGKGSCECLGRMRGQSAGLYKTKRSKLLS